MTIHKQFKGASLLPGAFFLLFLVVSQPAYSFTDKYDNAFRKWNAYYTPELPWYWLKSQAYIESALDPNAVSPVGAKGLTQFMDYTFEDMKRKLEWGSNASPFDPKFAIQAQAYYMKQLRSTWTRYGRNMCEIHNLALASYNAGTGSILKAQRESGGEKYWRNIQPYLKNVTGHHAEETTNYVLRFWRITKQLSGER